MTKMVQLSDDAYRRLLMKKRKRESFSDVVNRLAGGSLIDLQELATPAEAEEHLRLIRTIDRISMAEGGAPF